jgi:NAD(P)H-nitrite reductase large subunit
LSNCDLINEKTQFIERSPTKRRISPKKHHYLSPMPSNKLICLCKQVSEQEIAVVLRKNPTYGVEEIKLVTGASTSCGRCSVELAGFIERKAPKTDFRQLKLF